MKVEQVSQTIKSMQQNGINVMYVDAYGGLIIRISLQKDLWGSYPNKQEVFMYQITGKEEI